MLSGKFGWQLKKIKVLEDMNKIKKLVFSLFFFFYVSLKDSLSFPVLNNAHFFVSVNKIFPVSYQGNNYDNGFRTWEMEKNKCLGSQHEGFKMKKFWVGN